MIHSSSRIGILTTLLLLLSFHATPTDAFVVNPGAPCYLPTIVRSVFQNHRSIYLHSTPTEDTDASEEEITGIDDDADKDAPEKMMNENDFETLFKEEVQKQKVADLNSMEKAWRYAKRPLLSVGSKGATFSHGNSLRQLLEAHTAVKVKVNTRRYDGSLETAFAQIVELAEESGAPAGIEMVQVRQTENTILFGMPGTLAKIEKGEFPPAPPPPYVPKPRPTEEEE